jgi:hypothetical protein
VGIPRGGTLYGHHVMNVPAGLWCHIFRSSATVIAVLEAGGPTAGVLLTPCRDHGWSSGVRARCEESSPPRKC